MQLRVHPQRTVRRPLLAGALLIALSAACSGSVTSERPVNPGAPGTSRDDAPTLPSRPGAGPAPAATCSGRAGRPAWQLSTNTAFQVRSIVGQVFGTGALEDAQVRSLLENLPVNLKAKGFETEDKAVAAQFVDGYVALAARLAALASEQASVRTAVEAFVGKSCGGTLDLDGGCGLELARKLVSALERQPPLPADVDALLATYTTNKGKYQAARAYAGFIASVLLSAKSALRYDSAELEKTGAVDAQTLGARLAMTLTSALPDAMLRARMDDGSLLKPDVLRAEARRLLRTPGGRATLARFAEQWLNMSLLKSPPGAAGYVTTTEESALVARAAREEIGQLFVSTAVDKGGKLEDLFSTDEVVPAHDWLAKQYGTAKGAGVARTTVAQRRGLLTRVGFGLHGAHADYLPLAHRGYGVKVTMLCGSIAALPDNVDTTLPANAPDAMSSRQYFETLTERGPCIGCHSAMNSYGYALSGLSVTGALLNKERVRSRSTMQMVDVEVRASVNVKVDGAEKLVAGATELSDVIGRSQQAHACFAHRFDQFAVGVSEPFLCADDVKAPPDGRTLEDTILAYVGSAAFAAR